MGETIKKETRVLGIDQTNLKVERRNDGTVKIAGYAAVFNKDSEDMGFIERIKPGAFKNALRKSDVRALFNHDPNHIIGRTGVNLTLKEDNRGLYMEVEPIDTATYRMVAENIEAGLVTQQSFDGAHLLDLTGQRLNICLKANIFLIETVKYMIGYANLF